MKIALIVLAVLLVLVLVVELSLRVIWGFGQPLIYIADPEIGYLLAPSQKTRRSGNLIEINQYSMRSPTISKVPALGTWRVMLLGDSIVNGGWWTDQTQTLSALITTQLQPNLDKNTQLEILNVSANSWGPPNQLAYLKRFGTFGAQTIILVINTDDLFAQTPNSAIVGRDRNYSAQKPPLALIEVFNRYIQKSQPIPKQAPLNDPIGYNLEKIKEIQAIALQNQANFFLAMTPLLREVEEPGSRDYEIKARQRLTEFTEIQKIHYLDFLPLFKATSEPPTLFRDNIHLSASGNQLVTEQLTQLLKGF